MDLGASGLQRFLYVLLPELRTVFVAAATVVISIIPILLAQRLAGLGPTQRS